MLTRKAKASMLSLSLIPPSELHRIADRARSSAAFVLASVRKTRSQMGAPTKQGFYVVAALLALYLIWGSTYYAMRVALDFLPPFLMAGPRFLAAGLLLLVALTFRGAPLPTRSQWLGAALIGILLLVFGNGFVAIAQRSIASGVAATVVAAMPL